MMPILRSIGKVFSFIVVGIVTVIVGCFMIRGTMHLWDRQKKDDDEES
ncbi:MAG: hypothetical protein ACT4NT_00630 [Nitrososphaerota archaeon]